MNHFLTRILGFILCLLVSHNARAANIFLSDMPESTSTVGSYTLHYDKSAQGTPLSINGTTYAKGLGAHAASTIVYTLSGLFNSFTADAGIDDFTNGGGSVVFQVLVDDVLAYTSGPVAGKTPAKKISVNVAGKKSLKLIITTGNDGSWQDYGDWADAQLVPKDPNFLNDTLTIACIGNSITQGDGLASPATQGYVALIQKMFGPRIRVLNYGSSGRTVLKQGDFPYWNDIKFNQIFSIKPDIITVMLGTNDSKALNWTSASQYEKDLAAFVDTLMTIRNMHPVHASRPKILLCLPPPATNTNSYGISGTIIANQILPSIRKVAADKGNSIIDAHTPFLPNMSLLRDGVHPDTNGNKILADIFYETVLNSAFNSTPKSLLLWYGSAPGATANNEIADKPKLYAYPAPDSNRTGAAVIICPGGAYWMVGVGNEGQEIAKWFNSFGVTAFVLRYRVAPYRHPIELNDAKRAMRLVRYSAAAYGIDTNRIGIMGFSAGGHLASTIGTHFDNGNSLDLDPIEHKKSRPDFMALVYPVITFKGPYAEVNSRSSLLGANAGNAALQDSLSNEKWVTAQTPPTFMSHGDADGLVNIRNSMMFDSACKANKVPDTLVVEKGKDHGYALNGNWPPILIDWMRARGLLTKTVSTHPFSKKPPTLAPRFSVFVTPERGIRITLGAIDIQRIELLSIHGKPISTMARGGMQDFFFKPVKAGVYIVRVHTGVTQAANRVICIP